MEHDFPSPSTCMSTLCFSTLCFLFLWLLSLFPLATRCYPWLSQWPVHCLPTVSISVVVRRFHRWRRFRRCLGLPHRLRRIGHCPFLFHLANPTTVCFGHHRLRPSPSPFLFVDGLVWLVTNRPPVLVAVLAKVRHLAALGRSLFGHSGRCLAVYRSVPAGCSGVSLVLIRLLRPLWPFRCRVASGHLCHCFCRFSVVRAIRLLRSVPHGFPAVSSLSFRTFRPLFGRR